MIIENSQLIMLNNKSSARIQLEHLYANVETILRKIEPDQKIRLVKLGTSYLSSLVHAENRYKSERSNPIKTDWFDRKPVKPYFYFYFFSIL